jgi:hypothetical protein
MSESLELVIRNYYAKLRKKDKGIFLRYLITKYQFNYITLVHKLRSSGERSFTCPELVVINNVINNQEWKKTLSSSTTQTEEFSSTPAQLNQESLK